MAEPLFKKAPNKIVIAYDLFDKKHKRPLRNFRFRVGAYGILKKGEKILVQRHPLLRKYGLPGGGIDIGEKIASGLYREFKEETGLKVKISRLITVGENLFTWKGEDAQGIFIYYEVKKIGGNLLREGNRKDTVEVKFVDIDKLSKANIQKIYIDAIDEYKRLNKQFRREKVEP